MVGLRHQCIRPVPGDGATVRPAFEKYKGIGVRIEDDVLITTGEAKVLSAGIPSKLEEVEAAIAQLRKSAKSTPLP